MADRVLMTARGVRALVTPEGVDLQVRLGEVGARAAAFIVDMIVLMTTGILLTILAIWGGASGAMNRTGIQPLVILWLLMIFVLRNGYFMLFEAGRRGATPGKRVMGLRVVSRDGRGLRIDQVIARNLMREIEFYLPLTMPSLGLAGGALDGVVALLGLVWALIFTLFPMFNRDRLRIGDLLAGTWVIDAPRRRLDYDLTTTFMPGVEDYRFTARQVGAYGIAELQRLEEVLRVRDPASIRIVSGAIAAKIAWPDPIANDELFLTAYYRALRAELERGLLFGRRRTDKHAAR